MGAKVVKAKTWSSPHYDALPTAGLPGGQAANIKARGCLCCHGDAHSVRTTALRCVPRSQRMLEGSKGLQYPGRSSSQSSDQRSFSGSFFCAFPFVVRETRTVKPGHTKCRQKNKNRELTILWSFFEYRFSYSAHRLLFTLQNPPRFALYILPTVFSWGMIRYKELTTS